MDYPFVHNFLMNSAGHFFAMTPTGIFRSTDNQLSWEVVFDEVPLEHEVGFDLAIGDMGHVFAVYHGKVFRSLDNGGEFRGGHACRAC